MKSKIIDLDLAREFLNETTADSDDKKKLNAEKKKLRELREKHPIEISIAFKLPWWCLQSQVVD